MRCGDSFFRCGFGGEGGVDRGAQAGGAQLGPGHEFPVDEDGRCNRDAEIGGALLVGRHPGPDGFALAVFLEKGEVKSEEPRVGSEELVGAGGFAPGALFAVKEVVHFPELALEPGGLGGIGGGEGVGVHGEGKLAEDRLELLRVGALEGMDRPGDATAGRAGEITKFLEGNGRFGMTTEMDGFSPARFLLFFREGDDFLPIAAVEDGAAAKRGQGDRRDEGKGKPFFHRRRFTETEASETAINLWGILDSDRTFAAAGLFPMERDRILLALLQPRGERFFRVIPTAQKR